MVKVGGGSYIFVMNLEELLKVFEILFVVLRKEGGVFFLLFIVLNNID